MAAGFGAAGFGAAGFGAAGFGAAGLGAARFVAAGFLAEVLFAADFFAGRASGRARVDPPAFLAATFRFVFAATLDFFFAEAARILEGFFVFLVAIAPRSIPGGGTARLASS